MPLKTFKLRKEFCWITNCNKEASYYRKYDVNPRPICNEHFNKLPEIAKRHYFKIKISNIKSSKYGNMTLSLTDKSELKIEFSNGNIWLFSLYQTNSIRDFLNWYKK